jgi:hypothetical protein
VTRVTRVVDREGVVVVAGGNKREQMNEAEAPFVRSRLASTTLACPFGTREESVGGVVSSQ